MLNETYIRNLTNIVNTATDKEEIIEKVIYLTNDLKNDIAEGIKEKGQSGGGVDFIPVPEAIEIVTKGGKITNKEWLALAMDYYHDGNQEKADEIMYGIIGEQSH